VRRLAVIATLSKGYDLDYVWKQIDETQAVSPVGYYIQPAEAGGEPPGRWWGPAAEALGFRPGQVVEREPYDLVFCTSVGTPLDAHNVRRSFRRITRAAGLGENWTPRELRHSFVSIMSDNGVPIEQIADLVGHRTTITTQKVYRHQLKPGHQHRRDRDEHHLQEQEECLADELGTLAPVLAPDDRPGS
jgi:hypothetical protein